MRRTIVGMLLIVAIISLVAISFTIDQANREQERLSTDLQYRSSLLAETLRETIEPSYLNQSTEYLQFVVEKFANRQRLVGLSVYDHAGNIVAISSTLSPDISTSHIVVTEAMDANAPSGDFVTINDLKMHVTAIPLHDENQAVVGALALVQNTEYIDTRIGEVWRNNLIRVFTQVSLLSLALILLIRWVFYEPMRSLVTALRDARSGKSTTTISTPSFFTPLVGEISNLNRSLIEARLAASEEARVNLDQLDSPWTAQRLQEFVKDGLKDRKIVVVSNREPYVHTRVGSNVTYHFPASGMVTAIEPIMQACGDTWIAHGSGDADKLVVNAQNKIRVPPDEPKYDLRRVWLTEKEELGYYYGFANEGMWPLLHAAYNRPIFRKEDWEQYQKVNTKFADAVLSEIRHLRKPIILIQDFHFALLPRLIKNSRGDATIGLFWHIPWVSAETFSICPWKKAILDGMLGADLLGFHTQQHCNNFIETTSRELESLIDFERFTVTRDNHTSLVKALPISIPFSNGKDKTAFTEEENIAQKQMLEKLGVRTRYIGVGIDRLDYTKGILERLKAIEIFLHSYPLYQGDFTFIQVAAPSRTKIRKYQQFAQEVEKEVNRINAQFKSKNSGPIVLIREQYNHQQVNTLYRLAHFCLVTSLHDGMNLVAKEYIAARHDQKGVLILSEFTGASRELKEALIVNPYNGEQTAEAIHIALGMKQSEQIRRMKKVREVVRNHNVYRWSAELLQILSDVS